MSISRGEIWLVSLDPTVGAEIRKTRPVIVVSSDAVGVLPIKLVAPLTAWQDYFARNIWHVQVTPDIKNGIDKALSGGRAAATWHGYPTIRAEIGKRIPSSYAVDRCGDCGGH